MQHSAKPPDGPSHPGERCASCHGSATATALTDTYGLPPKPIYTCTNVALCKQIMILDNMIATIRSEK